MPEAMWGRPWQEWCDIVTHSDKVRIYQQMLDRGDVPTLPAIDVVRELVAHKASVSILTGASHEAVRRVMQREGLQGVHLLGWSATRKHKRERLAALATQRSRPHIVYVDDEDVSWVVPPTGSFVQYVGQSNEQLKEDIGWT